MKSAYRWWLGGALLYSLLGIWLLGIMKTSPSFLFSVVQWLWPLDILWFLLTLFLVYLLSRTKSVFWYYLFPGYYLLSYLLIGFEIFFFPHSLFQGILFYHYLLISSLFELVVSAGLLWYFFCLTEKKTQKRRRFLSPKKRKKSKN